LPGYHKRIKAAAPLATAAGMPVAWCLADNKVGEREAAEDLLGLGRAVIAGE
jgi:hypothetical protein